MNEIVTIYKIRCFAALDPEQEGESCSLLPWDDSSPDCRGEDDGGREYVLPEGYKQGRTEEGFPVVFGKEGGACELVLHNGCPLLVDPEKRMAHLLEPVKKIATYRHLAGLTLAELADRLGASQKEVYEWENLEKEPDEATLERIAEVLECNVTDFQ